MRKVVRKKATSRSRGWRVLVVVLALGPLAAWWWQRPRVFAPTCSPPLLDLRVFATTAAGLWCREANGALVFRDWQGEECWRITPPPHRTHDWPPRLAAALRAQLDHATAQHVSPDGNALLTVRLADGPALRVQVWRKGEAVNNVMAPIDAPFRPKDSDFCMMNRGRVVIALAGERACEVISIKGSTVTRGTIPYPVDDDAGETRYACRLSARDAGLILASPDTFHAMTLYVQDVRVSSIPRYTVLGALRRNYPNGTACTTSGELYQIGGAMEYGYRVYALSPSGEYALQYQGRDDLRVFSTYTDDQWRAPVHGLVTQHQLRKSALTDDGRFLISYQWDGAGSLADRGRELAVLLGLASGETPRNAGHAAIMLYERPGRLRTLIPLDDHGRWHYQAKRYTLHDWTLREDGRTLSAIATQVSPATSLPLSRLITWPK